MTVPHTTEKHSFGVIGGMGPASTLRFLTRVVDYFRDEEGAIDNIDFPQLTLFTVPQSDHMSLVGSGQTAVSLARAIDVFRLAGSKFFVSPCNTVHQFLEAPSEGPRLLSIVNAVGRKYGSRLQDKIVLILATRQTQKARIYLPVIERYGIEPVFLTESDQSTLDEVVLSVNAGGGIGRARSTLEALLRKYSADSVLAACTELSLLLPKGTASGVCDSLEALAEATYFVSSGKESVTYYSEP